MNTQREIHDLLNELAKKLNDEHGVILESVDFQWIKRMDGHATLVGCEINTSKH